MPKRRITGTVVSNAADKTVTVAVVRSVMHPLYRKRYRVTKKIIAHDPDNACQVGDTVTIEETRPLSARKRFIVVAGNQQAAA